MTASNAFSQTSSPSRNGAPFPGVEADVQTGREPVIDIRDMSFSYNGRPVLENVSLQVAPGEFLAILGPNGGGKTTLVKIILGLLTPVSGSVSVFGRKPDKAAGLIGYVPQRAEEQAYRQDIPITVMEVALMGLLRGWRLGFGYSRKEKEKAAEALERVEMLGRAKDRFAALSGGQQKRVLIARALIADPKLIIMDEPTANIDPQGKFCFYESLSKLGRDVTVAAVSHDLTILAAKVTATACVNRRLAHSPSTRLTADMLNLLYGEHRHSCPMDAFMHAIPAGLGDLRKVP